MTARLRSNPAGTTLSSAERAPWFVATFKGADHRFEFVNDSFRTTFGARAYEGRSVALLFPEIRDQAYPKVLDKVFKAGCRISLKDSVIQTRDGEGGPLVDRVIDVDYVPTLDARGGISGLYLEGFESSPTSLDHLSNRAADGGLKALSDAEILALLLYQQSRDQGAEGIAHQLLDRFQGLGGVLAASLASLEQIAPALASDGVRALHGSTALHLKLVRELGRRVIRQKVTRRPVLSSSALVRTFLSASLRHEPREEFHVLFLDHGLNLIADEVMGQGSVSQVAVYTREIMRRALELSATALILVHNHPSGSRVISADDRAMTMEIERAGQTLGIAVHDHLVVAGDTVVSLRERGVLNDRRRGNSLHEPPR